MKSHRGPTALQALGGMDPLAELGAIRFTLTCPVPANTDLRVLTQHLADQWRTVIRLSTGERYRAACDVFVPSGMPDLNLDAASLQILLVRAWAERRWHEDGEYRSTIMDLYAQAEDWLSVHYPVPHATPVIMPADDRQTSYLISRSALTARTAGPLPAGWAEYLPQLDAPDPR
ncbi:hypothetical protein [Streptomyces sp. Tue6028]|uniref:hypothetical protein n=1 Tax=Streptomyces sp. Tue6028 TaxID=2036037 RepID=UPI003D716385